MNSHSTSSSNILVSRPISSSRNGKLKGSNGNVSISVSGGGSHTTSNSAVGTPKNRDENTYYQLSQKANSALAQKRDSVNSHGSHQRSNSFQEKSLAQKLNERTLVL